MFRTTVFLLVLLAASVAHAADAPRQLMWADLVPKSAEMDNPFMRLTRDQLQSISDVAAVRDRRARGDATLTRLELDKEAALSRVLGQAGVDVDALLALRSEIAKRGRTVDPRLDGQIVRMPGYLLPLQFSGKAVTEFLLVPWVGACIHTPPPPPNQIIYVRPGKPVEMPGMFAPVWVTGRISATASRQSLDMIDGTSDIDIGYSLRADEVVPYTQ